MTVINLESRCKAVSSSTCLASRPSQLKSRSLTTSPHQFIPHPLYKPRSSPLQGSSHTPKPLELNQNAALPEGALEAFIATAASATPGLETGILVNTAVFIFGIKVLLKGLTWVGVGSSWFLGSLAYAAFGPRSYSIVCLYFIVGSLVTKLKLEQKQKEGIAEARSGRRSLGSVLGSGFAGILCSLAALSTGNYDLFRLGFIASFASKLADTTSSEVGKAYGQTTYLITTLQRVPRGTEGAVSLEGTLAGVVAAAGIGAVAFLLGEVDYQGVVFVTVAAFVANLWESWIGAAIQGKVEWLSNDVVNVLQICVAAGLAMWLRVQFGG